MKKTTYIMMALAAVILAAAGCAKQTVGTEGPASLMSIEPVVEGTKATLINDVAALQAQEEGFGLSVYNGDTPVYSNLKMQYSNGSWAPESGGPLKWPAGTAYKFYAWSPASLMTEDGSSNFTYSGIADQKDIMLGFYSGIGNISGNTCSAPIKFSHPLASVQFQVGTMTGLSKINSIKLSGVRPQGTCTVNTETPPAYSWSIGDAASIELSQTKEISTFTTGTPIGDPFLVLPQDLSTNNITVTLNVTPTSGSAKDITFTITSAGSQTYHQTGKTTIYKVNYDGQNVSLTVSIEGWTSGQSEVVAIKEKTDDIYINSFEDLLDFKSQVESGKNLSGITVYFPAGGDIYPEMVGEYAGINDPGVLDGVTIEGQGCTIIGLEGCVLRGGLFRNISSDNVTIKDLSIEDFTVRGVDAEPIGTFVSNYSGSSALTLSNCNTGDMMLYTNETTCSAGCLIGECTGNLSLKDCSVQQLIFNTFGNYQSGIVGKIAGPVSIEMERIYVSVDFRSTKQAKVPGLFIGVLDDCQGMTIALADCVAEGTFVTGYPTLGWDGQYYFSCDGLMDGVLFSDFHFYAIACNYNTTEYEKATATLSGIELRNCSGFPYPAE